MEENSNEVKIKDTLVADVENPQETKDNRLFNLIKEVNLLKINPSDRLIVKLKDDIQAERSDVEQLIKRLTTFLGESYRNRIMVLMGVDLIKIEESKDDVASDVSRSNKKKKCGSCKVCDGCPKSSDAESGPKDDSGASGEVDAASGDVGRSLRNKSPARGSGSSVR